MKKTFSTSLAVILVTVLAFVCITKPLQARAHSASMDYVETDMSTSDVKALFSGSAAFIPAAIMIIGFIVMTYCVLRNIEVPLKFSDQTSFSDKLTQLGQYAIDNAGDSIKDFLYSVYTYCNDNGITSIWGLSKFIGLQAGKFFGAITSWIGSSLINNVSSVGDGLLSIFEGGFSIDYYQYSYSSQLEFVFDSVSNISYDDTIGYFEGGSNWATTWYHPFDLTSSYLANARYAVFYNNGSTLRLYFYSAFVNGVSSLINANYVDTARWAFRSGSASDYNLPPNLSSYTAPRWQFNYSSYLDFSYYPSNGEWLLDYQHMLDVLQTHGYQIGFTTVLPNNYLSLDNTIFIQDVVNPAVDNVYVPTDVWNIDIVGTWEQIARDISATYDQTERIAFFVGDIPLTLTSAQAYAPTINDAGNYVFPDMTDIWKYPQYFFDTLKGWGSFVGNCLRSVTVGEGGLSWIFYGGFVLLVCGGIIGKILMG